MTDWLIISILYTFKTQPQPGFFLTSLVALRCTSKVTSRRERRWSPWLDVPSWRSIPTPSLKKLPLTAIPALPGCVKIRTWNCPGCHLWVQWNIRLATARGVTFIPKAVVRTATAAPFVICLTTGARPVVRSAWPGCVGTPHHPLMRRWTSWRCPQTCYPSLHL